MDSTRCYHRHNEKLKTFVLNDCILKIEVIELSNEFQILGLWNNIVNYFVFIREE